jgi:hypothetical protein
VPASAAKIGWVSFHGADNTPSAAAVTAGFTQAPDIGYTNALTAAGHQVTRVVTHGMPFTPEETATLNGFDLIMLSRSVPSGNFQDPPETLFWNTTITKPVMILGGYIARANRMGQYTGSTIPDTGSVATAGGPVRLQVTNPSHPIFAGIPLDGTNTMVNLYADVATTPFAPNTPQRGISVVTGPISGGGQVLATVNTAGDLANGGTVIAKFPPGATMSNAAPANVLGGHRLLFLTGSREHDGLTSEGSGIYDLSADGRAMFLNAVNFMVAVPEPSSAMLLLVAVAGLGVLRRR